MIKINIPESSKIKHKEKYYQTICHILNILRSGQRIDNYTPPKKYFSDFYDLFMRYNILIDPPDKLHCFIQEEKEITQRRFRRKERPQKINALFSNIFSYDAFKNGQDIHVKGIGKRKKTEEKKIWNAWIFLKSLNTTICPYCNADTIFATTVTKDGKDVNIRSTLDHYYPKSKYPFLSISLYNLIPACNRCNSNIKGVVDLSIEKHTHPYNDNFHDGITFQQKILNTSGFYGKLDGFEIELEKNNNDPILANRADNTARFFSVTQIYNALFKNEAGKKNILMLNRIAIFYPKKEYLQKKLTV